MKLPTVFVSKRFLPACLLLIASALLFDRGSGVSSAVSLETTGSPAAASLSITPITWGTVGLDSNNVTVGPNTFPVGARVCNVGDAPATNLISTFSWTTVNALISLRSGSASTLNEPLLAASACADLYYEIEITRSVSAYNSKRGFVITATADGLGSVSTQTPREIYVEKLVSQNRNSVVGIKLNGANVPFGGTMNLMVGNTYTIELIASTATNGYEQIESFINLPNVIFQTIAVSSTYTAPTGYTGNKLYEDACGWNPDPIQVSYRSCIGPVTVPGGKTGGQVSIIYTVKVLSGAGTAQALNTLIYDFSGSSYHYNSDFSTSSVIASIAFPTTSAGVSLSGRVLSPNSRGVSGAAVTITDDQGSTRITRTGSLGYYRFDDLEPGRTYIVALKSRRYTYQARIVQMFDSVADFDFF